MIEHSYWIVLLPLISAFTIFFFGRWLPTNGAVLGILSVGYGLIHSIGIFFKVLENPTQVTELSFSWYRFGIYQTELGILMDGLTALMLLVVTLISFLVHVYSLGYMDGDPRFKRYYAYLSFFTFAMLLLVVSNNFLQIFIGWELVGVASYFLIGFWFEKSSAASAGLKAFITTKLGDLGFFVAILVIFSLLGTLNFLQVEGRIGEGLISTQVAGMIALLLFCGAVGKSAQVPLHVWLPDAMEGPTPISALIHAATMVAAGVFMVARTYFIFQHGAFSLEVVAWVGGITAFLAATMALVEMDIKRILAFSTVSQLGYMMLAMGVGGREAGMFHLTTHAFFKALLFLAAGSAIHAVHTNDIREMGGLSKKMIWTFITFTFAWLAISGIWPFAGFFSKDAILEAVHRSGHTELFWLAVFVAFLTAFYMTRLYLIVFVTEPRNIEKFSHAEESPYSMVVPMIILAILSFGGGLLFQYGLDLNRFLGAQSSLGNLPTAEDVVHSVPEWFVPLVSTAMSLSGIVLAFLFYLNKVFSENMLAEAFRPIYKTLQKKYYFDELYLYCLVKPVDALAGALAWFDLRVFDQWGVDGVGWVTIQFSKLQSWIDDHIIDALVDFWGNLCQWTGASLRKVQTGFVQNYLLFFSIGFLLLVLWRLKINLEDLMSLF